MNLLERAREGDMSAQKELFFETVSPVYYICSKLRGNQNEAITACIATFKRVFSSLERLDNDTDFSAWVKTAAAITCCTELRRADREVFLTLGIDKIGYKFPYFPSGYSLNMGETAEIMEECIDSLSISKRAAIILYYFLGLTVPQIAKVLQVPQSIAKELLVEGRRKLEDLGWHLKDSGVKTCSMALLPIFELLSSILVIPDGIHFEEVAPKIAPKKEEPPKREEPIAQKPKRKLHIKRLVAVILIVLLIAGGSVFAVKELLFKKAPQKYSFGENLFSLNFDCVSKKLEGISPDSLFLFETDEKFGERILSDYLVTRVEMTNPSGEAYKTLDYAYSGNTLVRLTSSTEILSEQLSYKWTKGGSRLTVKNADGEIVEQTDYNSEGYPLKQTLAKETLSYKWTFTYDDHGRVKTAKYSSDTSGSYSYKYDKIGRVSYQKFTRGGITETEETTYDDFGMPTKKKITAGSEKKEYKITYNYQNLTFSATCSDGSSYSGTIVPVEVDS